MNTFGVFHLRCVCRVLCGLFLFCEVGGVVGAVDSTRDRFLKEAPLKWLEYRRIVSRHTEGTFKNVSTYHIGEEVSSVLAEVTFALNSDCNGARVQSQIKVEVLNPGYSFILKGDEGKRTVFDLNTGVRWVMPDDLIGRCPLKSPVMGQGGTFGSAIEMACVGQTLWCGWFPLMVSSPDFRLVRVTDVRGDGELVKVEFEFEPKERTGGSAPARSGMVVLDATRYWLIREAETKAGGVYGEGSLAITNEFTDGKLLVPFVSRCTIRMVIPVDSTRDGKRYQGDFVWHIDMRDAPELDRKHFTLTAYGFPEPRFLRPSRAGLWLVWVTIAVLAFCVGLLIYRRYRPQPRA